MQHLRSHNVGWLNKLCLNPVVASMDLFLIWTGRKEVLLGFSTLKTLLGFKKLGLVGECGKSRNVVNGVLICISMSRMLF